MSENEVFSRDLDSTWGESGARLKVGSNTQWMHVQQVPATNQCPVVTFNK